MTQSVIPGGSDALLEVSDMYPIRPNRTLILALVIGALTACSGAPKTPDEGALRTPAPVAAARAAQLEARAEVGDGEQGFVWWLSSGGALAVIYVFEDTDGSGAIELAFGHHGESLGDRPVAYLVDLSRGTRAKVDQVVATSPSGSHVATMTGSELTIWDGATGAPTRTSGWAMDLNGDGNACMTPRQLAFDGSGGVWYQDAGSASTVWRALEGGETKKHWMRSGGRPWRTEAVAPGWGAWLTVPDDTDGDGALTLPRQNTSCACLHCNRFAASFGFYGWGGDAFAFSLLPPGGADPVPTGGYALPLTRASYVEMTEDGPRAFDLSGGALTLPDGCKAPEKVRAAGALALLECQDDWRLWSPDGSAPDTGEVVILDVPAQSAAVVDGAHWVGAVARAQEGVSLARVNLEDGAVTLGAPLGEVAVGATRAGDWIAATSGGALYALDVVTGAQITGGGELEGVSGHVATGPGGASLIDYTRGLIAPLPARPDHTTDTGCALLPAGEGDHPGVERGPWTLWCAEAE
jgi:hypothetical protein